MRNYENGQILKNVEADSDIDNFFQRTIKTNEPITLWFQKGFFSHTLIGLKIGDKTYVSKSYKADAPDLLELTIDVSVGSVTVK